MYGFNVNFVSKCLDGLESVAVGFNHPVFFNLDAEFSFYGGTNALNWLFRNLPRNLRSVDASHILEYNPDVAWRQCGCHGNNYWTPMIDDFFPPMVDQKEHLDLPDIPHWRSLMLNKECSLIALPRRLTYIGLQHTREKFHLFSQLDQSCTVVMANSLLHLNMSNSKLISSKRYKGSVYGLNLLQTLDLSFNELVEFNFSELVNFPSLKVLNLKGNTLGNLTVSFATTHSNLKSLDVSFNRIENIPRSMFAGFTSLETLDLRGNLLDNLDFISLNLATLSYLDIGNNNLQKLTKTSLALLDRLYETSYHFLMTIDKNPFRCDCDVIEFITWIHMTTVNIDNRAVLTCDTAGGLDQFITDIDLAKVMTHCLL